MRCQHAALHVELPHKDPVEPEIDVQHEAAGRIRLDHVRVRSIVAAEGEAARWRIGGALRTDGARIDLHVRRLTERPVGAHGQDRD